MIANLQKEKLKVMKISTEIFIIPEETLDPTLIQLLDKPFL
jgi:hypothetical protein